MTKNVFDKQALWVSKFENKGIQRKNIEGNL